MKKSRIPQILTVLVALGCAPFSAVSGEVYKCYVAGKVSYQDQPCTDGTTTARRTHGMKSALYSDPADSLSLAAIHQQMQELMAVSRTLYEGHQKDLDRLKLRLAGSTDAQLNRAEVDGVHAKWIPRIREIDQRMTELRQALQRRCPGGASLNSASQTCNK